MKLLIWEFMNLRKMNNYINNDTICAISTPQGVGAIAVVRMSGKDSLSIVTKIFRSVSNADFQHGKSSFGDIFVGDEIIDEVVVTYFQSPKTYTGEDIVEIACHGSRYIQQRILELLVLSGARLAMAGEFTFRAYRNGKMDLAQSEAVSDLIFSENKKSHDVAMAQLKGRYSSRIKEMRAKLVDLLALLELELDFGEEDVEFAKRDDFLSLLNDIDNELVTMIKSFELGNVLRNGIPVTIIGKPNVGKSTLLNCLLNEEKAIVSEVPGTTRDVIEDIININGYSFRFIDTAGLHKTDDVVENIGIERTKERINKAKIVLHIFDAKNVDKDILDTEIQEFKGFISREDSGVNPIDSKRWLMVGNKVDEADMTPEWAGDIKEDIVFISAKRQKNIQSLIDKLCSYISAEGIEDTSIVTNVRHIEAMRNALNYIRIAKQSFGDDVPTDLISIDVHQASYYLGSIVGEITNNELLDVIFGRFCIGK